jgi:hypothetical protein
VRSRSALKIAKGLGDTRPSGGHKSVSIGAADQNRSSAETNRFNHIAPAPDAPIHHDFNLAIHCTNNLLECPH